MIAATSIAALAVPILVAYVALRTARLSEPGPAGAVFDLSLAVGVGLGASSVLYFLWLLLLDGSRSVVVVELVALAVVTALWLRRRRRSAAWSEVRSPETHKPAHRSWVRSALIISFCVSVAFASITFLARSAARPHGGWDARLIWNLRARFLFRGGSDWPMAFSDLFGDWTPTDYPLLIPGSVARAWSVAGAETTLVPIAVAALFSLATLGLLVAAATRLRGLDQGLLAGIVLLGTRGLARQGPTQFADIPLGFFILAILVSVTLWLQADGDGGRRAPGLAGLCTGLAAWTKNEGLLVLLVVIVALGLVSGRSLRLRRAAHDALAFLAGLLPLLAVVVGFKWFVGSTSSNYLVASAISGDALEYLADPGRYVVVAGSFFTNFYRLGGWLVSLPLVLVAYLLVVGPVPGARLRRGLVFGSVCVVLLLAGYFAVYMLTPRGLAWHLQVTLYRLVLHVWPGMLFLFFVAARAPGRPVEPAATGDASVVQGSAV